MLKGQTLNLTEFETWLSLYGKYWENGDSKSIRNLFSEGARYYETPFDEPMVGLDTIEQYWSEGAEQAQEDVSFVYSSASISEMVGLSRWQASFIRIPSGVKVELDGYLEAKFNDNGLCLEFREWWHRKETE